MLQKLVKLLKQTAVYSVGGFAGQFVGIFLVPIYTRIFLPADYGVIELITVTITFLTTLLILGTTGAVARFYVDSQDTQDKMTIASTIMYFRAALVLTASVVLIFFAKDLSHLIFQDSTYSKYLIIALATLPFALSYRLCLNILRFRFQSVHYAITSVGYVLLHALLAIYLVVVLRWGIAGVFGANLISSVLFFMVILWFTKKSFSFTFSTTRLRELLHYGIPLVPAAIAIYLMHYCDRYFLIYFTSLEQVGLYGIGSRLASILLLLLAGFQLAWLPFFWSTYRESDSKIVYSKVGGYFWALSCFMLITLSLFSREILTVFTTPQYIEAYKVVPFLVANAAFFTFGYYFCLGIEVVKKTIHRAWVGIAAAGANIGLNFLLVPVYGMIGAAVATLISSVLFAVLLFTISQRYYHVSYNLISWAKMFLITVAIVLLGYYFLSEITWQHILIKTALILIFGTSIYAFGIIGKAELSYAKRVLVKVKDRLVSR